MNGSIFALVVLTATNPGPSAGIAQGDEALRDVPTLDEIASRFEQAHRNAHYVRMESTSTWNAGLQKLWYSYEGTQDSLRTICIRNDNELYGAFSVSRGRVQEYVIDDPKRTVLSYDSDRDNGMPVKVNDRDFDCLYGGGFQFWVGPRFELLPVMCQRIREADRVTVEDGDGRPFYRIYWNAENPGSWERVASFHWTLDIDCERFVLRRYVSEQRVHRLGKLSPSETFHFDRRFIEIGDDSVEIDVDVLTLVEQTEAQLER